MPTFKESRASGDSEHCPLSEGGLPSTAVSPPPRRPFSCKWLLDSIIFNPCFPHFVAGSLTPHRPQDRAQPFLLRLGGGLPPSRGLLGTRQPPAWELLCSDGRPAWRRGSTGLRAGPALEPPGLSSHRTFLLVVVC